MLQPLRQRLAMHRLYKVAEAEPGRRLLLQPCLRSIAPNCNPAAGLQLLPLQKAAYLLHLCSITADQLQPAAAKLLPLQLRHARCCDIQADRKSTRLNSSHT